MPPQPPPQESPQGSPQGPPPSPNHPPALTVTQLHAQLTGCVSHYFSSMIIRGEVGRTTEKGGHIYFTLKDGAVSVSAVVWSRNRRLLSEPPTEGREVVVQAAVKMRSTSGEVTLDVTRLELTGEGRARQELKQREERLRARGAFERDRTLPALPAKVALITSEGSAAYQDFMTTASERAPGLEIRVLNAQMQGEGALRSVSACLDQALADPRVEVVVLTRGGGAMEDLAVFHDEQLTLKIAAYPKPIVVSIGHESDILLAEMAATRRARTPTEAAHMVIPHVRELQGQLEALRQGLEAGLHRVGTQSALRLNQLSGGLRAPDLAGRAARVEELSYHAESALRARLARHTSALDGLWRALLERAPLARVERFRAGLEAMERALAGADLTGGRRARLERAEEQLRAAFEARVAESGGRFGQLVGELHALSPLAVLSRGYSLTTRASGEVVRAAAEVSVGDEVVVRLHDGELAATVRAVRPSADL